MDLQISQSIPGSQSIHGNYKIAFDFRLRRKTYIYNYTWRSVHFLANYLRRYFKPPKNCLSTATSFYKIDCVFLSSSCFPP
jgi:hypothetical protein